MLSGHHVRRPHCRHLPALLGLPDEQAPLLHTPLLNASITSLLTRPGEISLGTFNSVARLELAPAGERLTTYR